MIAARPERAWVTAERRAAIAEAVRWLDTPFHHGACIPGVGVDCVHLVFAAYEAAGAMTPEDRPWDLVGGYAPEWFLHQPDARLVDGVCQFAVPVSPDAPRPGDLALFRFGRAISHIALVTRTGAAPQVIHAFRGHGVVLEDVTPTSAMGARLDSYWTLRRWIPAAERPFLV